MFKKLVLLSIMLSLGACETISQANQCVPEKNYVISNTIAMQEYENKIKNNIKTSVLFRKDPVKYCNDDACSSFDSKKFNFIEKEFNDKYRKGIYTIIESDNLKDERCFRPHPLNVNNPDKKCFIAIKNVNDVINSEYTFTKSNIDKRTEVKLTRNFDNENLYKVSYQVYSTSAIDGPGFSFCKKPYVNNPDYKFHMNGFVNGSFSDNSMFYKNMAH
jgi:hypothetical protein